MESFTEIDLRGYAEGAWMGSIVIGRITKTAAIIVGKELQQHSSHMAMRMLESVGQPYVARHFARPTIAQEALAKLQAKSIAEIIVLHPTPVANSSVGLAA